MSAIPKGSVRSGVRSILGVSVVASDYDRTVENCLTWAKRRESRALFFANVHVIMEAFDDRAFRDRLNKADMVNPDGVPLVWTLRALGETGATRVYGPDATVALLAAAEREGLSVGFFGGKPEVLDALVGTVTARHPDLNIVYVESPPFRTLTAAEDEAIVNRIHSSGAQLLFVGLGCPKQETWIAEHLGKISAVMLGVGAAFDFIAGTKPQAPRWMMRNGLEWAFRFVTEPRRLAKRYFKHNPRFMGLVLWQLLGARVRLQDDKVSEPSPEGDQVSS